MDVLKELPIFLLLMIGIAVASLLYLLYRIITIKKGVYVNALGLKGIPSIDELRVKDAWSIGADVDEFVHIADTLKNWTRSGKSLAAYVEDEDHREALLKDLYSLKERADFDLEEEDKRSAGDKVSDVSLRRKTFLNETFPYQKGQLLAWEPPIERKSPFKFRELKGRCIFTYSQDGAVTKLKLELQETGVFSVSWRQAGDVGEKMELIEGDIKIDDGTVKTIKFSTPKRSGTLFIRNLTRKAVERVPVS